MPNVMVNNATGGGDKSEVRCFRCNQHGHGWRNCHLPWQKTLALGARDKVKLADQLDAVEESDIRPDQALL